MKMPHPNTIMMTLIHCASHQMHIALRLLVRGAKHPRVRHTPQSQNKHSQASGRSLPMSQLHHVPPNELFQMHKAHGTHAEQAARVECASNVSVHRRSRVSSLAQVNHHIIVLRSLCWCSYSLCCARQTNTRFPKFRAACARLPFSCVYTFT